MLYFNYRYNENFILKCSSGEYYVKWPFGWWIYLSLYDGMADWINVLSHFTHDFTKNPGINIYIMVNKSPTSGIQYICHMLYIVISLDQLIPPCNIHAHGQPFLLSYSEHPIHNQLMGSQYAFCRDAIKPLEIYNMIDSSVSSAGWFTLENLDSSVKIVVYILRFSLNILRRSYFQQRYSRR